MARDKQIDQEQKQSNTAQSSTSRSPSAPTTERERDIATGRERGAERGNLARPYSASIRELPSPFGLMRNMAFDLDRLFEQFGFGRKGVGAQRSALDDVWAPQVEIVERGDKLVVRADLPGLKREDVDVEVEGDVLTLSGERKQEHEEEREGYYRSERSYGQFFRSIPLPDGVNADQAEASFKDGVLEVSFPAPKQEQRRSKKIQIR